MEKKFNSKRFRNTVFYTFIFFFTILIGIRYNNIDVDLWARLLQGKYVVLHLQPMLNDVFSYAPKHIWYDPEWISSAILYLIEDKFDIVGLTFLKGFLYAIMLCIISFGIKEKIHDTKCDNHKISYYILLILAGLESGVLMYSVRCQSFSFILLAIWILLLEKVRHGKNKYLFVLPILMLIWLNMHGACIAGYGILFLYFIGEFLNKKPCIKYLYCMLAIIPLFLINPWGINYIKFLLMSAFIDRSWILEWGTSFNIQDLDLFLLYKLLMIISIISYGFKIWLKKIPFSQLNKTKLIIMLVLAFLSVRHIKHIMLLIICYSIYCYEDYFIMYDFLMNKLKKLLKINSEKIRKTIKFKDTYLYFLLFILIALAELFYPYNFVMVNFYKLYPVKAVNFLNKNNIKGNLFTVFSYNSYIMYKCYPNIKIFVDGRQEQVFDKPIFDESMYFYNNKPEKTGDFLDKYNSDIVLTLKSAPITEYMDSNEKFKKIYEDRKFRIYLRNKLSKFSYDKIIDSEDLIIKDLFKTNANF